MKALIVFIGAIFLGSVSVQAEPISQSIEVLCGRAQNPHGTNTSDAQDYMQATLNAQRILNDAIKAGNYTEVSAPTINQLASGELLYAVTICVTAKK